MLSPVKASPKGFWQKRLSHLLMELCIWTFKKAIYADVYAQYWDLYPVACKRIKKINDWDFFFCLNNAISACQDNMVVVELKTYIWNYRYV